jgi:hypothetical protein
LRGAIATLTDRKTLDFQGMMCGKICFNTLKWLGQDGMLNITQNKIPMFMHDMDLYYKALDIIAETNHIAVNPVAADESEERKI